MALPPTVIDATNALTKNCIFSGKPKSPVSFTAIMALIAPLKTPHTSPITSAHTFATIDAFFINFIDVFAPFTFLVAFA